MGLGLSKEEKQRRRSLEHNLSKMQRSLHVTAHTHYISSEYYRRWNIRLQYISLVVGAIGATGGFASTFGLKSATSALLSVSVKHFRSGIECQYLEKKVKFISETEVWDSKIPWASLASKYETLLRDKKDVDSLIQTEYWAYRKALKVIEEREREKREQTLRVGEETMQ